MVCCILEYGGPFFVIIKTQHDANMGEINWKQIVLIHKQIRYNEIGRQI